MSPEQALRKVLACLRMASSSNPTEAATALRQARALMEKNGLTEADAHAAGIQESEAVSGFRGGMVPRSMLALANLVADGYRCEVVIRQGYKPVVRNGWPDTQGKTVIRFFGAGAEPRIAAYAFTVLRRQLQRDKGKHTARVRKRANKEARGEEFAFGWISAVRALFPRTELPDGHGEAIQAAIRLRCGETRTTTGKEIGKGGRINDNDHWAGYQAGKQAQLNRAISEGQRKLAAQ
jgi:hypothetical protein